MLNKVVINLSLKDENKNHILYLGFLKLKYNCSIPLVNMA